MSASAAERLRAGLNEDEADIKRRWGSLADTSWVRRPHREVAAKRRILALYEEFAAIKDPGPIAEAVANSLGDVVATLAGIYENSPE